MSKDKRLMREKESFKIVKTMMMKCMLSFLLTRWDLTKMLLVLIGSQKAWYHLVYPVCPNMSNMCHLSLIITFGN